jgi:hypothetical protein
MAGVADPLCELKTVWTTIYTTFAKLNFGSA